MTVFLLLSVNAGSIGVIAGSVILTELLLALSGIDVVHKASIDDACDDLWS